MKWTKPNFEWNVSSNVLDLNAELRYLRDEIFQYTGTHINGNFYFSAGSTKHRVSFDPHNHDYNVILKPIYGKSIWQLSGSEYETSKKSLILKSELVDSSDSSTEYEFFRDDVPAKSQVNASPQGLNLEAGDSSFDDIISNIDLTELCIVSKVNIN